MASTSGKGFTPHSFLVKFLQAPELLNPEQTAQSTPTTTNPEAPETTAHTPITGIYDITTDIELLNDLLTIKDSLDEERAKMWMGTVATKMKELLEDVRCLGELAELEKMGLLVTLAELKERIVKAEVGSGKVDEAMGVLLKMLS